MPQRLKPTTNTQNSKPRSPTANTKNERQKSETKLFNIANSLAPADPPAWSDKPRIQNDSSLDQISIETNPLVGTNNKRSVYQFFVGGMLFGVSGLILLLL